MVADVVVYFGRVDTGVDDIACAIQMLMEQWKWRVRQGLKNARPRKKLFIIIKQIVT